MSRDTRIEEVVRMAKEVFGDNVDVKVVEVTPKKEDNTSENTTEGTLIPNSLISDEEKEQVKVLVDTFDKLMNLHKKEGKITELLRADKDDYTMLQYMMYGDYIRSAIDAIKGLSYVCNEMTKEDVDEVAEKNNTSTKEMVVMGMMHVLSELSSK